jgi:hypothetical protein
MGIGALAKLGISKGMSIGRELFGFLLRSDLNVAKIAEGAGVTLDTLESAPPRRSERHSREGCAFWGHRPSSKPTTSTYSSPRTRRRLCQQCLR